MRAGPSSLLPFKTKRKKKHLSILIVVESRRVTEERNVCLLRETLNILREQYCIDRDISKEQNL